MDEWSPYTGMPSVGQPSALVRSWCSGTRSFLKHHYQMNNHIYKSLVNNNDIVVIFLWFIARFINAFYIFPNKNENLGVVFRKEKTS